MAKGAAGEKAMKGRRPRQVGFAGLLFQSLPELWAFHTAITPLLALVIGVVLNINDSLITTLGIPITSANLSKLVLSWQGPLCILLLIALALVVVACELFAPIHFTDDILQGRPTSLASNVKGGFAALRALLSPQGLLVLLFILFVAPLCGVGFTVSLTSRFYIPNFIMDALLANSILRVLYNLLIIVAVAVTIANVFLLHGVIVDGMDVSEASRQSRHIIKEQWRRFIPTMALALLQCAVITVLAYVVFLLLPKELLEACWPQAANAQYTPHQILQGGLSAAQRHLLLARIIACFVIVFGRYLLSVVALMESSYFMMCLTRFYRDCVHGEQGPWPSRPIHFVVLGRVLFMLLLIAGVAALSCIAGIYFEGFIHDEPVKLVAHRCGGTLAPENSIEGLEVAIEHECFGSETDTQRTLDGYYIINHDDTFARLAGVNRAPKDMTLQEVRELALKDTTGSGKTLQVPTLEEFLDVIKGNEKLLIELKGVTADRQMVDDVVALVREKDCVDDVILISLKYDVINYAETTYPEFETGTLLFASLGDVSKLNCDYLLMEEEMATRARINQVHRANKKAGVWTVNTEDKTRAFLEGDLDLIITDYVETAEKIQDELDARSDIDVLEDWFEQVWDD